VRHDVEQVVAVFLDQEIKAPTTIDPTLPNASCLVVLFGSERRMAKILSQQDELFIALTLNHGGGV
jgi:hypothetical protein